MKKIFNFLALITLILGITSAQAGIYGQSIDITDLQDKRTFNADNYHPPNSEGGLSSNWTGFSIMWDIDFDDTTPGLWHYEYTLQTSISAPSHFILELSDGSSDNDIQNENGKIEFDVAWGFQNNSNTPGWPDNVTMRGIKFDFGGNPVTYSFDTNLDPVWGNFYSKGGNINGVKAYAYNKAFEKSGFDSNQKIEFIPRPDGGDNPPIIPEPISSILFLTGGATIALRRYYTSRS